MSETGWLIERRVNGQTMWWDGFSFHPESLRAVRFCRKVDAERVMKNVSYLCATSFVTEHEWVGPDTQGGAK